MLGLSGCHKEDPLVYVAGTTSDIVVIDEENNKETSLTRGKAVYLDEKTEDEKAYRVYLLDEDENKHYYLLPMENMAEDFQNVVTNQTVTANMLVNLRLDRDLDITDQCLKKDETVQVVSVNMERDFNEDGTVDGYMVSKDGKTYYLSNFYTLIDHTDKDAIYYSTFYDRWFGEGYSKKTYIDELTYLPVDRTEFKNKPLKKDARALHIGMSKAYEEKDYLINLCKETGIDTLVLEIKSDDGNLIFESETAKKYLKDPTKAQRMAMSKDTFQTMVEDYKAQGIYLIGRVVAFKDPVFASEYPQEAICYTDGSLYLHNDLAWPSPYSRKAWQYLLSYCKEAVALGIDEIQFDYVRFPDNMASDEESGKLNMHNTYQESKPQAIQHFLYYAREELRNVEAYLSADVFGWNMICGDDQNIGQFIPAIASVVDVISPMPYPDHFSEYSLGIEKPWQAPGELMKAFTEESMEILNSIESPALYRSWIQGYACLDWVCDGSDDNPSRGYGPSEIIEQIQGIREAGQTGYIVWSGNGGAYMFEWRKSGFIK